MTTTTRRTRRTLLFAAAALGGVATIAANTAIAAPTSVPVLLGRKNGGPALSKTTVIENSAGTGKATLQLKNDADAGTGLRSIADLAVDARGAVNVADRLRVTGGIVLGTAKSGTIGAGLSSASVDFGPNYSIPDGAVILATSNTSGSAVVSAFKTGDSTIMVTLDAPRSAL